MKLRWRQAWRGARLSAPECVSVSFSLVRHLHLPAVTPLKSAAASTPLLVLLNSSSSDPLFQRPAQQASAGLECSRVDCLLSRVLARIFASSC